MKSIWMALLYGFLAWLIPFGVGFILFPIRLSNRPLFDTLMPLVVALCAVVGAVRYFRRVETAFIREGLRLGGLWFTMSLLLDVPTFLFGPIAMPFAEYLADIGLTYLLFPMITLGLAYARTPASACPPAFKTGA